MQPGFPIIDPHIHQWDPYNTPHAAKLAVKLFGKHPKLLDQMVRLIKPKDVIDTIGLTEHLTSPYLPINYKHDIGDYHVEQVIHVEASWHEQKGFGPVNETCFIESLDFSSQGIQLSGIVATADPRLPIFHEMIQRHQDYSPRFRGIRKMAAVHPDRGVHDWTDVPHLYTDTTFLKGFEVLAKAHLSFDAWVYSNQIQDVTYLAKAFPDTPIVLDHLGTPVGLFGEVGKKTGRRATERESIFEQWKVDIAKLAECPNVYTKMSGLFMPVLGHSFYKTRTLATKNDVIERTSPLIQHTLNCFGSERVMFASNFPMDRVNCDLVTLIDGFSDIVLAHNENAISKVFYENAQRFYDL